MFFGLEVSNKDKMLLDFEFGVLVHSQLARIVYFVQDIMVVIVWSQQ